MEQKLIHTGTYKDGGSKSFRDKDGNKYWLSFKFGEKNKDIYGKLFIGDINNEKRILVKGIFIITNKILNKDIKIEQ